MSFSTGGLFLDESLKLAELFLQAGEWVSVKKQVRESNLIQARTMKSLERIFLEASKRLECLSSEEKTFLVKGNLKERQCLLWLAVCRTYPFIAEFAREVLREKFLKLSLILNTDDYNVYLNKKAEVYEEVESLSESTRVRLRQVLFKMLREADLLTSTGEIRPISLSPSLARLFREGNPEELTFFPMSDDEIRRCLS
jgi:hypothetical protein